MEVLNEDASALTPTTLRGVGGPDETMLHSSVPLDNNKEPASQLQSLPALSIADHPSDRRVS